VIPSPELSPGQTIRRLMREIPRVIIGTIERDSGDPYASLAMAAVDFAATPLLLLSNLADHSRNLKADSRISLLFDGTLGRSIPLAGARATAQGRVVVSTREADRARYVRRHPDAEQYLSFGDFNLYRVEIDRAHLVAGFGRIHWVPAAEILWPTQDAGPLAEREPDIVQHMNDDHADALQLYAERLLGRGGTGWRMTGVDPEGADLRRGGETARLWFEAPVNDAEACRAELVRWVKVARSVAAGPGLDRADNGGEPR
jgi:putative heme iron utilization protein